MMERIAAESGMTIAARHREIALRLYISLYQEGGSGGQEGVDAEFTRLIASLLEPVSVVRVSEPPQTVAAIPVVSATHEVSVSDVTATVSTATENNQDTAEFVKCNDSLRTCEQKVDVGEAAAALSDGGSESSMADSAEATACSDDEWTVVSN